MLTPRMIPNRTIIIFGLAFFFICTVGTAQAQEVNDTPLIYDVQITLMDISDVDYANGGYSLSFWITLSSDKVDFTTTLPPDIDFVNGKIDSIDHEYADKHSYSAKVHGTFFTNMEFQNYPIMNLSLPIIVEPIKFETHEIKFTNSKISSTIDDKLTISGLIYKNTNEKVLDYTYPDGDVFSRYVTTYNFETPFLTSFLVGIFPILVMAGTVIFLFSLNPTNHDIKVEMIVGVLIAAVFFHVLDVGESLPPLEYLTLEDKAMTILYTMLGVIMVEITAQRRWNEDDDYKKAKKIDKKFRVIFIIVVVATIAAVWNL